MGSIGEALVFLSNLPQCLAFSLGGFIFSNGSCHEWVQTPAVAAASRSPHGHVVPVRGFLLQQLPDIRHCEDGISVGKEKAGIILVPSLEPEPDDGTVMVCVCKKDRYWVFRPFTAFRGTHPSPITQGGFPE